MAWLSWLFTPIVIAFLLPLLLCFLVYGCVIWLHIFKLRHRISAAFHSSPWEGARSAIAGFWDAQGWFWHGYEVSGLEHLPESGPALIVYYHGALPIDVYYLLAKAILYKHRYIHCVADKFLFRIPGFRLLCDVFFVTPGSVSSCVEELKGGNLLCISPGGVREALFSSSKNYEILWGSRLGFAKVALQARVPVIPMFTENIRESFRTPSWGRGFFRWLYEKTRLPLVPIYGGFPVKLRTFLGPPLEYPDYRLPCEASASGLRHQHQLLQPAVHGAVELAPSCELSEDDRLQARGSAQTIEPIELRNAVETALLELIETQQRRPGNVLRALLDRFPVFRHLLSPAPAPNYQPLAPEADLPLAQEDTLVT